MLYRIVKKAILSNKHLKHTGGYIGIPMPFKRLSKYIPLCAERGHSVGILGGTGGGKSRYTRFVYIYHVYKFHKETGYPVKIIYLPLEDNKEKVMRNMICHYMKDLYGIYINLQELDSKGDKELPDYIVEKLEEAQVFFKDFENIVTIVDGIHEPTSIYNFLEDYAKRTGVIKTYDIEVDGQKVNQKRYIANNDVHTVVIVDNMSNLSIEKGFDERRNIVYFCKDLVREKLCNFYKFTVVQVIQQDFASERQSFNRDGDSVIAKLEPSLAGVGNAKEISRSMHIIYGLFHPSRFGIASYPTPTKYNNQYYRIDILGNRFRSLNVLKANDCDFGMKISLWFDAVAEHLEELPELGSAELESLYKSIQHKHPEKFSKIEDKEGWKPLVINKENEDENPF